MGRGRGLAGSAGGGARAGSGLLGTVHGIESRLGGLAIPQRPASPGVSVYSCELVCECCVCLQVGSGAQGEVAGSRQLPRVQTEATHVPLSPLQRPFLRGSRLCQGPRTVLSQTPLWLETHFMNALTFVQ